MGTLYEKLSPGPGKPPPEVSSHQRTRLRGAMIEIAGEGGFGAVTVRKLTHLAGVSTRSFYEQFGDKQECFLSTYEWLVRRMARGMMGSQEAGQAWRQRLHLSLRRLTHDLAAEPKAAHLLLVEAFAVGPSALESVSHAEAIFEAVVNASLAQAPEGEAPPPFATRAIVAGATCVARARLLAGRTEELPAVADELMEWALSFSCGSTAASDRSVRSVEAEALSDLAPAGRRERPEQERSRRDPRALVLGAVAKLAARGGYEVLSPTRIRAAAGVSRRAFDAHFEGVHDCYLAAVEELGTEALGDAEREGASAETWPTGLRRAVTVLCDRIGHDPTFARLAFTEDTRPAPGGIHPRERLISAAAERLRQSAPARRRPSKLVAEASVGAAWDSIHRQVAAGQGPRLPQQADRLAFLLLAPVIGGAAATGR